MGLNLNIAVPNRASTESRAEDRVADRAHARRTDEAHAGEAQLSHTYKAGNQAAVARRDSFQRTQQAAQLLSKMEVGRQDNPEPAMPTPDQAQAHAEAAARAPESAAHSEAAQQAAESTHESQEAKSTTAQQPEDVQAGANTTDQTIDIPAAASAPEDQGAHNEQRPTLAQTPPRPSQEEGPAAQRRPTTQPRTESEEEGMTPEQRFAQLTAGGRTTRTASTTATLQAPAQVSSTTVANPEGAPVPTNAPETHAQQALAKGVHIMCAGDPAMSEDHLQSYEQGLRSALKLAHQIEQPAQPQTSPLSTAVFQHAAPAMTREQMLTARLTRDNSRGREGDEGGLSGVARDSDLSLRYQLGTRRDMGAA